MDRNSSGETTVQTSELQPTSRQFKISTTRVGKETEMSNKELLQAFGLIRLGCSTDHERVLAPAIATGGMHWYAICSEIATLKEFYARHAVDLYIYLRWMTCNSFHLRGNEPLLIDILPSRRCHRLKASEVLGLGWWLWVPSLVLWLRLVCFVMFCPYRLYVTLCILTPNTSTDVSVHTSAIWRWSCPALTAAWKVHHIHHDALMIVFLFGVQFMDKHI